MNGILGRAVKSRWIAVNPALLAEKLDVPRPSGDFNVLKPVEIEACAREAARDWQPLEAGPRKHSAISQERAETWTAQRRSNASQYAAIIRIAAYTGLRLGELRALRWSDIDWANAIVHVRRNAPSSAPADAAVKAPKSGRVRSVPLIDQAARTLELLSRRGRFTGDDDLVFPSPMGVMVDGPKVRDAFYRALSAASLGHLREKAEPITFHDLRHTFGTLAVRAFPVTEVKEMMGHADIQTTMRYVHYVPRHDAARKLSAVFAVDVDESPAWGVAAG